MELQHGPSPAKSGRLIFWERIKPSQPEFERSLAFCIVITQENIHLEDLAALEKDYEEVGIETAEGEGEEEGYGDEF